MTSILQLIYFHEKKSKKLEKEEMLSFRFYEGRLFPLSSFSGAHPC